ncbi:MAG: hybrid sensor histidine kinase/response regulator [Bacteroidales bacterium]|nr:hybrid sensor histidine kinase/response regulator [Bacteroidales bacterium]
MRYKLKSRSGNERRVRYSAAIIFLMVAALCTAMIYYISNLRNTISEQRRNIRRNEKVLSLTNSLIRTVNEAQASAQLYTFSSNPDQLQLFKDRLDDIKMINDSIVNYSGRKATNKVLLDDLVSLLQHKELIISNISKQYEAFNPYDEIYNLLMNYKPERKPEVVAVITQDTIVKKAKKKNFFERLFSSESATDSIILLSKTTFDTIDKGFKPDNSKLLNDIQIYSEKGKNEYLKRIKDVEDQYHTFILADQNISEEISGLLITLHKQTLETVMGEVQKSDVLIRKNLNYSIYSGTIALVLILLFITLIFYDIQKVSKARKEREEALRRADEIMESRHKLLLSVSHDIKAPLSSVIGYIELMKMEKLQPHDIARLNSMKYSSEHILSLLSNLLEFSSLDQGRQFVKRSDFDISELCDQLRNMLMPIAENKQLKLFYHKGIPEHLHISSDPLKIKQIISNIISNSLKYTIEGEVHFGVYLENKKLIFSVIDSGIGIPEDKIEEMFKPFSRAENNTGLAEGNGFGLYVVKGLLDLLGGKIKMMSKVGEGTHTEIIIPIKLVEKVENKEVKKHDEPKSEPGRNLNILLVDDDNSLLTVASAMLAKLGQKSDFCRSSVEFSRYLDIINNFDIVITDREMGTFSGIDVLHSIKSIKPEMQVIIMTARDEYGQHAATSEGFDGYLKKPFRIKDLAELLHLNWNEEYARRCSFSDDFPGLCTMFDNDEEAIKEILDAFVKSTSDNLVTLNDAINEHDFAKAQSVCHKMKPMFIQLEQKSADYLTIMDGCRGQESASFPDWEEKGVGFMEETDTLMNLLSEKYDISD